MKQCLFCSTIYLDEFDKCPKCSKASYKSFEEAQSPIKAEYQNQEVQEEIDLTKIPNIKNPNVFLIFGIIICVFLALSSLCFII